MRLSLALLATALVAAGCADPPPSQTLSGRIASDDFPARALGVRAVEDGRVVAQAALDSEGRFELAVPQGSRYRLEVVTRAGIHQFIVPDHGATKVLAFDACGNDWDFGDVDFWEEGDPIPEDPGCDSSNGMGCGDPEPCADGDPNCGGGGTDPGECQDPMDPNCGGDGTPGCDPETGIGCEDPPPCDTPDCSDPPPCDDMSDPNCGGGCDPSNGTDCEPPPPCDDPNSPDCDPCLLDPTLCEDPCATDPSLCDPCMGDPDCDPCLNNPEWCWPGGCDAGDGTPSDGNPMDNGTCWPDDPMCSDDDPNCWPDPVEPPGCENAGMDPDQPCWDEPPQGAMPEDPPADDMCG